jgi:uncharacterized lipoprotein YbaY
MKPPVVRFLLALGLLATGAGCNSLDLTPETDPQRVVSGMVKLNAEVVFPPDAVAVVRVIDPNPVERLGTTTKDLPVADINQTDAKVERVLGEQIIRAPGTAPIPFRVEFQASDATMRRGLSLDVRISQDGKVRYRTLNAPMITLISLPYPQEATVELVR